MADPELADAVNSLRDVVADLVAKLAAKSSSPSSEAPRGARTYGQTSDAPKSKMTPKMWGLAKHLIEDKGLREDRAVEAALGYAKDLGKLSFEEGDKLIKHLKGER